MLIKNFTPQPSLLEFVRYYQLVHLEFSGNVSIPFKAFAPRPENCLCFFPADPESLEYPDTHNIKMLNRSEIIGQHLSVTNRHIGKEFMVIRVIFQPGALFRLTGIPSSELTNSHIDAESVFSNEIRSVNDRLGSSRSYPEILNIIEAFLLSQVNKITRDRHVVDLAGFMLLQNVGNLSMDMLAEKICLSPRQFSRKFNEHMGISPNVFARIARFDRSLEMKNNNLTRDWLTIALDCGYYDYQHMARDYKDFTGLGPAAFLKEDHHSPENALGFIT